MNSHQLFKSLSIMASASQAFQWGGFFLFFLQRVPCSICSVNKPDASRTPDLLWKLNLGYAESLKSLLAAMSLFFFLDMDHVPCSRSWSKIAAVITERNFFCAHYEV